MINTINRFGFLKCILLKCIICFLTVSVKEINFSDFVCQTPERSDGPIKLCYCNDANCPYMPYGKRIISV